MYYGRIIVFFLFTHYYNYINKMNKALFFFNQKSRRQHRSCWVISLVSTFEPIALNYKNFGTMRVR